MKYLKLFIYFLWVTIPIISSYLFVDLEMDNELNVLFIDINYPFLFFMLQLGLFVFLSIVIYVIKEYEKDLNDIKYFKS